MICCFKRPDSTTTQLPICRRRHQKSLKELESKKLAPNLESKVIGPPDPRHKSIRHPSTHEPPEQTPKPFQKLVSPLFRCQIHKTEKSWTNNANRSTSNINKPKQATKSTTTSTTTNTFSTPPSGPLYRLSSQR